jgi:hypothetical protein
VREDRRGFGNNDLATMCDGPQPRASIHGRPVQVARSEVGFAGVQDCADLQAIRREPRLPLQRKLRGYSGRDTVRRPPEYREPRVSLATRANQAAGVTRDRVFDQCIMPGECEGNLAPPAYS